MSSSHQDATGAVPSSEPSEDGARLARRLDDWLTRADELAKAADASDMRAALGRLIERHHAPGFRVAVVGEFSRGKSTLINALLGRNDFLPVGSMPTTALMTSVLAGAPERMEVIYADGTTEQRELTGAAWADLIEDQPIRSGGGATNIVDVRVVVENVWLHSLDAEIVDTPGADDLAAERAAVVYDVLARTDAAVFVVTALLPFSLTERTFLENEVLGRHIDRLIVVVTQLDKVEVDERERVMQSVRTRVGQVAPRVPIVASHPMSPRESDERTLAEVRALIDGLAATSDRLLLRSRQIALQLVDWADGLAALGGAAAQAVRMSADQRTQAVRDQRNALFAAEVQWNQISTQLDERAVNLEGLLRKRIASDNRELLKSLEESLSAAHDPKAWWDKQYPRLLSQGLFKLGQRYEAALLDQVNGDIDWLVATVKQSTNRTLSIAHLSAAPMPSVGVSSGSRLTRMRDWRQMRLLSRLGLGAASVALFFFIAPVSLVVTVGVGVVSEKLIDAQEKQQRDIIRQHLASLVAEAIDRYAVDVAARVRGLYARVSDDMRQEQAVWTRSAEAVLQQSSAARDNKTWEQMIAGAERLRDEVIDGLAE